MQFTILQSVYKNDKPEFLDQCFESIKNNSLQPVKIVLVKDGQISTELDSIITKWCELLPIQVVGYEQNHGLAYALNYGLQFVETELVARMDSDDICYLDRFEKQINYFKLNPDCEICGTGLKEFYAMSDNDCHEKIRLYPEFVDKTSKCLYKGTPLGHPTLMMKTEILKRYKYSENTSLNEDIDLWFRLIKDGYTIHNIQEPLLNFRITDGTFKRRSIKKAWNEFKIYFSNLMSLFGFSSKLVFPIARFLTRFLPYSINKKLYFSDLRTKVLKK